MSVSNPLAGLVDVLAAKGDPPPRFSWVMVQAVSPLRVRRPGEDAPVDVTPMSLVPATDLVVGKKALVLWLGTTVVVLGVARDVS